MTFSAAGRIIDLELDVDLGFSDRYSPLSTRSGIRNLRGRGLCGSVRVDKS